MATPPRVPPSRSSRRDTVAVIVSQHRILGWPLLAAVVGTAAVLTAGCSSPKVPPPRAADWPVPLVETPDEIRQPVEVLPQPEGDPPQSVPPPPWGADLVAQVHTPEGKLGPRTEVAVDPRLIDGISWTGSRWQAERDWNEEIDGGYLDFGAAALDVNGHQLLGFRIEVPAGMATRHVVDGGGEVGYFEMTNPRNEPHNSYLHEIDLAHHYVALGVAGDAIKLSEGAASHHDAYIEMDVLPGGADGAHYDGVQAFRSGSITLERIVIDWNDAGTIANTTGAIFTQDAASLTARDIIVLDPGGTWQPIRLSGSGPHDVDDVQVTGQRRPNNNQPNNDAPIAIVKITNDSDTFTLHNEVPGTDDWLIP